MNDDDRIDTIEPEDDPEPGDLNKIPDEEAEEYPKLDVPGDESTGA